MIEEAIVDAHTPSEQAVGFHVTLDGPLELPFDTAYLSSAVTVRRSMSPQPVGSRNPISFR